MDDREKFNGSFNLVLTRATQKSHIALYVLPKSPTLHSMFEFALCLHGHGSISSAGPGADSAAVAL